MGTAFSYIHHSHGEQLTIDDGDIRRLWSCNSSSGGKYMCLSTTPAPPGNQDDQAFIVKATGEAEGTSITNIRFDRVQLFPEMFALKFKKDSLWYTVCASGSENGIIGTKVAAELDPVEISFRVWQLWAPNEPYVVFESGEMIGDDKLYLSSDGAGNMKLKLWNKPIRGPPDTTAEVDPALLFRVVRPLGESGCL